MEDDKFKENMEDIFNLPPEPEVPIESEEDLMNKEHTGTSAKFWNEDGLSFKQWQFCQEYLINFNASQAYFKVYGQEYNNSANIMKSPKVLKYIRERIQTKMNAAKVTEEWINEMLMKNAKEGNRAESNEALKILNQGAKKLRELDIKLEELKIREKELELKKENPTAGNPSITLNIKDITKEKEWKKN